MAAPTREPQRRDVVGRFGGLSIVGSSFGALVTIGAVLVVGGLLIAAFDTAPAMFDASIDSYDALVTEARIIGLVTLFLASLLGGWCAARSSRFAGIANALLSVGWVLLVVAALDGLGSWLGNEYDVFVVSGVMPTFLIETSSSWGVAGLIVAVVLMLVGAAVGGVLGESWNRDADRRMRRRSVAS